MRRSELILPATSLGKKWSGIFMDHQMNRSCHAIEGGNGPAGRFKIQPRAMSRKAPGATRYWQSRNLESRKRNSEVRSQRTEDGGANRHPKSKSARWRDVWRPSGG